MNIRIIPRLDIKGANLVKGVQLEGLRVLGKPEDFARHYYENGADELLFQDIVASLYQRNSLLHIVERTAREISIPLTVGGGLRSLNDIQSALRSGADKVALNTAAIKRPELIREASLRFGSSSIVVSIEAILRPNGNWECFTDNGRTPTGVDACQWAEQAAELGAGEIILTSVNNEGTGKGFDLALTRKISENVSIPVIACGGAGSPQHIWQVIEEGLADAVSVASILHYPIAKALQQDLESFTEGNVDFLRNLTLPRHMAYTSLPELKHFLSEHGYEGRDVLAPASQETDCVCKAS
ncbi:imidazole glycerol phosphate synthase subunit HisF [Desulfovibrio ferrophilus]|uniref:imidazole glycerol-phosphate synthase n=1 Tax=Desulfovibrio ferrophilus TaxID=241368 RepID=A0A2Z6B1F1_9BACT|nr:imidazole glycerol phosphate synthase cyclase subunit [Desulfovibrio ferrophilus]BBD09314.1 1-(5-phosphoribosyl)-5-[(5-phosphoribosylamino) methylideneamino]imidazole-4-carboxamide isomerase [Desulfovibrio ferrophilus]